MEHIEEYFEGRIRHIRSLFANNDDELRYGETIQDQAETIEIMTSPKESGDLHTLVNIYTDRAVYHFHTFKANYIGHASRTLVDLLLHFGVSLPIEFVVKHQTFVIYITGGKIVIGETLEGKANNSDTSEGEESATALSAHSSIDPETLDDNEFPIAQRNGAYELVEYFGDLMSSRVVQQLEYLAEHYQLSPVEIVENGIAAMFDMRLQEQERLELELHNAEAQKHYEEIAVSGVEE